MFCSVLSAAISGVECVLIRVEADVSSGLPIWNMVGYLSSQVREAQERVRTAVRNAGISLPVKRITINLAPADIRKEGTRFDLPIAAAMLGASGEIPPKCLDGVILAGELSLDGRIQGVKGILPLAEAAGRFGCNVCVVPKENEKEAATLGTVPVLGVENMKQFLEFCRNDLRKLAEEQSKIRCLNVEEKRNNQNQGMDFWEIRGQESLKRAAVVAASGFHNFLITGPQGTGKTMLAGCLPGILPPLTMEEKIEISRIHSIAGLLSDEQPLLTKRPYRAPHHTVSPQALAGGGRFPKPGELTLAHRGILFLDEFPEFSHACIEILRQPLEEHRIHISRTGGTFNFPAHCMLVATMNHCLCGKYPDVNVCTCSPTDIRNYEKRISGPVLDRIDIQAEAENVGCKDLHSSRKRKSTSEMYEEVERAYKMQIKRYEKLPIQFNSQLSGRLLEEFCCPDKEGEKLLEKAFEKWKLSVRSYHKILRTARTIADLAECDNISSAHISEAIGYKIHGEG